MPDVPFAVAVLAAAAPIIAGAIPLIVIAIQGASRDKRDRRERAEEARQQRLEGRRKECAKLLKMARDFRVAVANNYEYSGEDKAEHVRGMRQRAASITSKADEIGLLVPGLSAAADALADAANQLAEGAADPESLALRSSTRPPDTAGLDRCIRELKSAALDVL